MSDVAADSESRSGIEPPAQAVGQATQAPSFGRALAAAREALGLSAGEIASRLRLHPRQIAALESEQMSALPEATFVRGFIRNYAKEVKLDPTPLLAALDARLGPAIPGVAGGADQGQSRLVQAAERERLSRQLVIAGALAALVVLGAIGWLATQRPSVSTPAAPLPSAATRPAPPPTAATEAAPSAQTAPGAEPQTPTATAGAPTAETASDALAPAEPADASRSGAPSAGALLLRINIEDRPSWIEVAQQPDGRVVYSGLNEAGTERRLLVTPPVRVTVGNASTVKLEFRGKSVDLSSHVRGDDVARLTLE